MTALNARSVRFFVGGLCLLVGAAFLWWRQSSFEPSAAVGRARTMLAKGRPELAAKLVQQILDRSPNNVETLILAGSIAAERRRYEEALKFYRRLPDDDSRHAVTRHALSGDLLLFHLQRGSEAEAEFRQALAIDPQNLIANSGLVSLLTMQARRWASIPHLMILVRRRACTLDHLISLSGAPVTVLMVSEDGESATLPPEETRIAAAKRAMGNNRLKEAAELFREELRHHPQRIEAYAGLGTALLGLDAANDLDRWSASAPDGARSHPQVWSVSGDDARRRGETRTAIRCYWEALRRDPNHLHANHQLAQLLTAESRPTEAAAFRQRAKRLDELRTTAHSINSEPDRTDHFLRAAELCESLGRLWEAWGWHAVLLSQDPRQEWSRRELERLQGRLRANPPQTLTSHNPAEQINLSEFPLPKGSRRKQRPADRPSDSPEEHVAVRFADSARSSGIDFTFANGDDPQTEGRRMFEITGGGVAAFDYDDDGWPDVCFTQGGQWPPEEHGGLHRDRLYRNLGDGRFEDVTAAAGLGDGGFSQGVAVGDFNGDRFADLFVANVGRNRLYANNGDGTFDDVSDAAGIDGSDWTTSCLLADLNGDAWLDLYAVNYLAGEDVFDRICEGNGQRRSCSPHVFPAAQDRLYLNRGNGTFEDVTAASGIEIPDGKGLGIVAADFDGSRRLSLFVANDQVANFFFVNDTAAPGGHVKFREAALSSGLSVDRDGRAQACMGVAAGDADGDGRLDLFVTNFFNESNTLYLQRQPLLFSDATAAAGLRDPGFPMLGFGTQFVDGDLDGLPDLVVVNGHVDDYSFQGTPDRMPPQYFRNIGRGRFVELSPGGRFFQEKQLGRGLATLDWNRDGKEDFAVTHLDTPAALMTNRTAETGRFLAVRLRGVESSRDAIGSIVRLTAASRTQVRQLTAGDGYQASNQRQLIFGLGAAERIETLTIQWPSGAEQTFRELPVDREILLIEGRAEVFPLPR